jgi:RNA polymerase sigma-70 factor (ECF subfamily)
MSRILQVRRDPTGPKQRKGAVSPCDLAALSPRQLDAGVELMLRVQRDEDGAFAELVNRYWTAIFGRFYRQLGDRQEAEDLAQDVFLRLYRARQRYQAQAKFTTWLFHIAQNVARNALRTRRRKPCIPMGTLTSPEMDGGPATRPMGRRTQETPSQPMERAEMAAVVRSAVRNLARRQRRALELFQFQDWSCGEIAERMDMTPKAARSLLYRARNQLRDSLTAYVEA